MLSFLLRLFSNSLALGAAFWLVPGFVISNGLTGFMVAGLFLGTLNLTIKPILKLISMPLVILTLGAFSLIINGLMLWLVSLALDFVVIQTISALIWSTLIISLANLLITATTKVLKVVV